MWTQLPPVRAAYSYVCTDIGSIQQYIGEGSVYCRSILYVLGAWDKKALARVSVLSLSSSERILACWISAEKIFLSRKKNAVSSCVIFGTGGEQAISVMLEEQLGQSIEDFGIPLWNRTSLACSSVFTIECGSWWRELFISKDENDNAIPISVPIYYKYFRPVIN